MYFIPELVGALTLDAALTSRFDGLIDGYDLGLPATGGDVALGWRHYLDPWGRGSLGVNLGLAFQPGGGREPGVYQPRLGVTGRVRGLGENLFTGALGIYAELGPVLLDGGLPPTDFPELAGKSTGFAWSVGAETSIGRLVHLSPYVFGDVSARIGVEAMRVGGISVTSFVAGLRLGFDWAFLDPHPEVEPPGPGAP
jgi:hypothetical protein